MKLTMITMLIITFLVLIIKGKPLLLTPRLSIRNVKGVNKKYNYRHRI